MPRALVTGAGGFAGTFLAAQLREEGTDVWAALHGNETGGLLAEATTRQLDVRDAAAVAELIDEAQPDEVYHLAGLTRPASGDVSGFYGVNLDGARNVLEAVRRHAAHGRVLLVGSAYAYEPRRTPLTEGVPLVPHNHYGASKAAAEMIGRAYAAEGLHVALARPFNHSGPGQSADFVLPTVVQQLVEQRAEKPAVIQLGNLHSVRDISDVRDIVRGYRVLLRDGSPGAAYNLGSEEGRSIRELVDMVSAVLGVQVRVKEEPRRARAGDLDHLVADTSAARALGWRPSIPLQQTIADMAEALSVSTLRLD